MPTVGVPGGQEGLGTLLQGYIEQSNVSIVDEFINLIQAQRGYEANSKVVRPPTRCTSRSTASRPMIPLASFALAGCLAVGAGSDRITRRRSGAGVSRPQPARPETPVAPGARSGCARASFALPELRRLAARLHLAAAPHRRSLLRASGGAARSRASAGGHAPELPGAIEILDYSRQPAPEGDIEFPVAGCAGRAVRVRRAAVLERLGALRRQPPLRRLGQGEGAGGGAARGRRSGS